jgi:hypothetical protein
MNRCAHVDTCKFGKQIAYYCPYTNFLRRINMKTKKNEKKLKLNKSTIASLNRVKMSKVIGGCPPPSQKKDCTLDTFTVM